MVNQFTGKSFNLNFDARDLQQFYKISTQDVTLINGHETINKIERLGHLTAGLNRNQYGIKYLFETFERKQEADTISTGQKDFWRRLSHINDDLDMNIDYDGSFKGLFNIDEIVKKKNTIKNSLQEKYQGSAITSTFKIIDRIYAPKNTKLLKREYEKYKLYGFLLHGLYQKWYDAAPRKTKSRILSKIIGSTSIGVDEYVSLKRYDTKKEVAILELTGVIKNEIDIKVIDFMAKKMELKDALEKPKAILNTYKGEYTFCGKTGALISAYLDIDFSVGNYYKKKRRYETKQIHHSEI